MAGGEDALEVKIEPGREGGFVMFFLFNLDVFVRIDRTQRVCMHALLFFLCLQKVTAPNPKVIMHSPQKVA